MSMREYPSSGLIIPIEKIPVLPQFQEEYNELLQKLENGDIDKEQFMDWFSDDNVGVLFPSFELYCPADEDTVDEPMEHGHYYAIFAESDFYEMKPKPILEQLKAQGVIPEKAFWSVWG